MCRFLLVTSKKPIKPKSLLIKFAKMAKKSKALDGDWQGDGWGIAWIDEKNKWKVKKSLEPVWQDSAVFDSFPKMSTFAVHARSASFPEHRGILEYNQPYTFGDYAFVFNGLLKGVKLPNIPGRIGAEKIWYLLKKELKNNKPDQALDNIKKLLVSNTKNIIALNIGLVKDKNIYSLNYFTKHPEYYSFHKWNDDSINALCSENIKDL